MANSLPLSLSFMLAALTLTSAPVDARANVPDGAVAEIETTATAALAAVNTLCVPVEAGRVQRPDSGSITSRRAFLAAGGFRENVPAAAWALLGEATRGMADADIVGFKQVGSDFLILAIGGSRFAQCRVAIASRSKSLSADSILGQAVSATGIWRADPDSPQDAGPLRLGRYLHQPMDGRAVELIVASGNRNLNRTRVVLITAATTRGAPTL